jgi:hypothetical protein
MAELILTIQFLLANPLSGVNPDLQKYFDSFTAGTGVGFSDLPAGFADLESPMIGVCVMIGDHRWVYIDKSFWAQANEEERRAVVHHELGHCVLDLPHDEAKNDECPAGLMFPALVPQCLAKYPERYSPESLVEAK